MRFSIFFQVGLSEPLLGLACNHFVQNSHHASKSEANEQFFFFFLNVFVL